MPRTIRLSLIAIPFLLLLCAPLAAAQAPFFSFTTPDDSVQIRRLVEQYLTYSSRDTLDSNQQSAMMADELGEWISKRSGAVPSLPRMTLGQVRPIRSDGSLAIVTATSDPEDVPMFGPVKTDWVFFTRLTDAGWRLSALRRQTGADAMIRTFRSLDSTTQYPLALKKVIARESAGILMSNDQLREHFNAHRAGFQTLAGHFHRRDSLYMMGRSDRVIIQLNNVGLEWGIAAQEVPQEAIDEFMKMASPQQKKYMEEQIAVAAKMRRYGMDTLQRVARRFGYSMERLDSAVSLMRDLHVNFGNSRLPWEGAVQFTIGGANEEAVGYLYSPKGEVPFLSSDEYFYLEDLGGGWWIFRAT